MDDSGMGAGGVLVDPHPHDLAEWAEAVDRGWLDLPQPSPFEEPAEPWQLTERGVLAELARTQAELSRIQGRWLQLLAEAERREATLRVAGLPTASWLVDRNSHWPRQARDEVRLAVTVDSEPELGAALQAGALALEQVRVVARGLDRLPPELDRSQRAAVAAHLVELGAEFGPYGLSRLVNRAVEVVAPEAADDADRRAIERAEAAQRRGRFLTWHTDPDDGSLLLSGKLPAVAGQKLVGLVKALGAKARKVAALAGEDLTRGQAHADALVRLAEHYAGCRRPPRLGVDRPRILVSVDHDVLLGKLGTAVLLNTDEVLSAQQARLLACDAGVLPVVMGADGVPLDVGRERRLFTGPIRALLIARDRGCAFPGCDVEPAGCEAHHIRPWHAGGRTSLSNGVLLCSHHHHLVEPDPSRPPDSQWAVRLDPKGNPEFGAPLHRAAPPGERRWRLHHRYRT